MSQHIIFMLIILIKLHLSLKFTLWIYLNCNQKHYLKKILDDFFYAFDGLVGGLIGIFIVPFEAKSVAGSPVWFGGFSTDVGGEVGNCDAGATVVTCDSTWFV